MRDFEWKMRQNWGLTSPHADHLACPHARKSSTVTPLQKTKLETCINIHNDVPAILHDYISCTW